MTPLTIHIPGEAQGMQRPRMSRNGHVYTPEKSRNQTAYVRTLAAQEMMGREVFHGAVKMVMRTVLVPAASWPKRRKEAALRGEIWPCRKPDLDNVEKLLLDAFNGIVWNDDKQVCRVEKEKRYGPQALTVVTVETLS